MAKQNLSEQLDRIVEALIARPEAALPHREPKANAKLQALAKIAAQLRDLPSEEFKARLKTDLERRTSMASKPLEQKLAADEASQAVKPIPEGFHTLTPYLAVTGAARLIEFMKEAFGAEEKFRVNRPGAETIMHAELRIADSVLELADASEEFGARQVGNILHVDDLDAVYRRALQAGATSLYAPVEQSYGDREAGVRDPSGNHWYITANRKTGHKTEDTRAILPHLNLIGAAEFVEFAKRAYAAEEALMYKSPDGALVHARIRIGDSILALGEAHGEYPPMPGALHMYVKDVDSVYATAVSAGAKILRPLRDEPYGDRSAVLQDPFGNWWFPSTHIKDVKF